jgi:glycosyltransferase involved in cell wall biosynthesis
MRSRHKPWKESGPSGSSPQTATVGDVSVVIPALNEARNLPHVLNRVPRGVREIIVVDGGSVDGTAAVAALSRPDVRVIGQGRRGKGNALAAGFDAATGDYVVMLDADGSMDPAEIMDFVGALQRGAVYAKGTRFSIGGGSDDITALRRVGNWALNAMVNVLFGTRYSDLCYGFNAFHRSCLSVFDLPAGEVAGPARWGDGFEVETILNTRIARSGLRVVEVASFERKRMHGTSNLRTFRDGMRVLAAIVRERLTLRRPAGLATPGRRGPAGARPTAALPSVRTGGVDCEPGVGKPASSFTG